MVEYPTVHQLRDFYFLFNKKYFEDKLPPTINIETQTREQMGLKGSSGPIGLTYPARDGSKIIIASNLVNSFVPAWVLMHEMIHVHITCSYETYHSFSCGDHCSHFLRKARIIFFKYQIKTMMRDLGLYPTVLPVAKEEMLSYMRTNYSQLIQDA